MNNTSIKYLNLQYLVPPPQIVQLPQINPVQTYQTYQTYFYPVTLSASDSYGDPHSGHTFDAFIHNGIDGNDPPDHYFRNQSGQAQKRKHESISTENKTNCAISKFNALHKKISVLTGDLESRQAGQKTHLENQKIWFLVENYKNAAYAIGLFLLELAIETNDSEHIKKYVYYMELVSGMLAMLNEHGISGSHDTLGQMTKNPKQFLEQFKIAKNTIDNPETDNLITNNLTTNNLTTDNFTTDNFIIVRKDGVIENENNKNNVMNLKVYSREKYPFDFYNDDKLAVKIFPDDMSNFLMNFYIQGYRFCADDFYNFIKNDRTIDELKTTVQNDLIIEKIMIYITKGYASILLLKFLGEKNLIDDVMLIFIKTYIQIRRIIYRTNKDIYFKMRSFMLNKSTPENIIYCISDLYSNISNACSNIDIDNVRKYVRRNLSVIGFKRELDDAVLFLENNRNNGDPNILPNIGVHEFLVSVNPNWDNQLAGRFSEIQNANQQAPQVPQAPSEEEWDALFQGALNPNTAIWQ